MSLFEGLILRSVIDRVGDFGAYKTLDEAESEIGTQSRSLRSNDIL